MITHSLKINLNNIKRDIFMNYFKYRDIFFRILITNICVFNALKKDALKNIIIEDGVYNQYFLYLSSKQLSLRELLLELNLENELRLYIDLSLYIDEFLENIHDNRYVNVYNIQITDTGYLIIFNKKLHKDNLKNA